MSNLFKKQEDHKSPGDWYVASILERFEWDDEDRDDPNRRCMSWENTLLIHAKSAEEAYAKAVEHGHLHEQTGEMWEEGNENRRGHWKFEGLTSLLAIYDSIEDGAEIMWTQHNNRMVRTVQKWVKAKKDLEVFQMNKQKG